MSHTGYSIYEKVTGRIVAIGYTEDLGLVSIDDDHQVLVGVYDRQTQYVLDGKVIDKPKSEIEQEEIDRAWGKLRVDRKQRLVACDWTQVPDAPVDHAVWAVYRQELRDLPQNTPDPRFVVWPTSPQ
jgi:hypothetical protein